MEKTVDYDEVYSLDSEDFEWLDLAEEFFKHDGSFSFGQERNGNVKRDGQRYDDIQDEWNQLQALYEALPEHVVEPLKPIYRKENGQRQLSGFYIQRFDGQDLAKHLEDLRDRESINEGLEVASEVREAVQYLHSEGLVHGDLANNILYDGETFKMFDPVGTPKDRDGYHRMKELDEHDYESLERGAKMPFEQFF